MSAAQPLSVRQVGLTVRFRTGSGSSSGLTHSNKPGAFAALSCGGALILQDPKPLVQSHRGLLRDSLKG